MAGAPKGNQNAAKAREFEQAMRRACLREDWKRFNRGIESVLNAFAEGEQWAVTVVRDTFDGKPVQQVDATLSNPDGTSLFSRAVLEVVAVDRDKPA